MLVDLFLASIATTYERKLSGASLACCGAVTWAWGGRYTTKIFCPFRDKIKGIATQKKYMYATPNPRSVFVLLLSVCLFSIKPVSFPAAGLGDGGEGAKQQERSYFGLMVCCKSCVLSAGWVAAPTFVPENRAPMMWTLRAISRPAAAAGS